MKKDFLKFPLRKALFSTVILFSLSAIFSSCGDDVEGRISVNNAAPEKVTNVKTLLSHPHHLLKLSLKR